MAVLDPRVNPFRSDLAAESLREKVVAQRYTDGSAHIIVKGHAALRRLPADDAPLDTELLYGEIVTVYDDVDGWSWLQNSTDGYVGYVRSSALGTVTIKATHRVAVLRSFVFPEPDLKTPPRDLLSLDTAVQVTGSDGNYCQLTDGSWIYAPHLALANEYEKDHVAVALRFVGAPYLWGGRTSIGLDCSALVQLSLARCGTAVPRDTDLQADTIGTAVEFSGDESVLQRGDLIYWKGHVGIWVDQRCFVHANATDMMVATGALSEIATRIEASGAGPVTTVRRP